MPSLTPAPLPPTVATARDDTPLAQGLRSDALTAARRYLEAARTDATWRAYESDWRIFAAWCADAKLEALPASAETLVLFLSAQAAAGKAPSTLGRRLAAIRMAHIPADLPSAHASVAVTEVMAGIRRTHGTKPNQKAPAVANLLKRMVKTCDAGTQRGRRDRALLLLGFAAALRRSEAAALRVEDLVAHGDLGLEVHIARSKTDQTGKGQVVAVRRETDSAFCPVHAIEVWTAGAQLVYGPLFRRVSRSGVVLPPRTVTRRGTEVEEGLTPQTIAEVVKQRAQAVGADPKQFAGHSLRAGFLTSAARAGATPWKMLEVSRHTTVAGVQPYVREAERFVDHAGRGLLD